MEKRIIAHLDMDAFFASLEEVATPGFLGKPIVVGSDPKDGKGRGVVSTANYKAREYGIHSALPISTAWKLSQKAKQEGKLEVIFLPVDFKLYERVSGEILSIVKQHSSLVEQASIDEFYFDLSSFKTFKKAKAICLAIKEEIREKEKVTCSIGIGPNKLISKIAANVNKPDGILIIEEREVRKFLNPLPIKKIPGIGLKTNQLLNQKGIVLIRDLSKFTKKEMEAMLGKSGIKIYHSAKGIDNTPVTEFHEVKSISEQTTFDENTLNAALIMDAFSTLSKNVFNTFIKSDFSKFKTITVTIRFSDFQTKTSSKSLKEGISKKEQKRFNLEILKLVLPFLDKRSNPKEKLIRLIGVRIASLI